MSEHEIFTLLLRHFPDAEMTTGKKGLLRFFIPYGNGLGCYVYPVVFEYFPAADILSWIAGAKEYYSNINTYIFWGVN